MLEQIGYENKHGYFKQDLPNYNRNYWRFYVYLGMVDGPSSFVLLL
ncbi:hypothetical protein [Maribacter antarcticus]|nr:hypothetical protein [Maribacter antarcticus]